MKAEERIRESIRVKQSILDDNSFTQSISDVAVRCCKAFRTGKKVLFCGNGGSAADAQHLAAEFSGKFYYDRPPLPSEALHTNSSFLTAVGNDYSFEEVYSRLLRATGHAGDVLIAISTSGNSPNILRALDTAKDLGMVTVGLTGLTGGAMKDKCDVLLKVPSADTPRIQESHIMIGHIICELVEEELFPKK